MSKNVLVVGGLGFVGAEVCAALVANGHTVTAFDNMSIGSPARLAEEVASKVAVIKGDVRNSAEIAYALEESQPDAVINLAAIHYIPQCNADPEATLDVNVMGTQRLISQIKKLEKTPRFIMTSSASAYGSPTVAPQHENVEIAPVDVYGSSKAADELLVRSQLDEYIIFRLFNVFGHDDPHPHLIPNIIRQLDDKEVRLGNKTSQRDYVYVKDVARAFAAGVEAERTGGTYNIGSGKTRTVEEVCETLKNVSGKDVVFEFDTPAQKRAKDPAVLQADISLIKSELGWRPRVSFEEGIEAMFYRLAAEKSAIAEPTSSGIPMMQG